ncbi:MAG TPA: phage portal protein [Pseudonocardia sp.]
MGLYEDYQAARRADPLGSSALAWPVGKGELVTRFDRYGHDDSRFSPEEYGDYLATSNDIYSVVKRRARLLSGLQLKFYRGRGSDKTEVERHAAVDLWWRVNPFWTAERLARMDEMSMGVWGESYWAVERHNGQPVEIWWLKPSRVFPVPDESNYLKGYAYHSLSGEIIPFAPDEIVWFRYPNPIDEFSALSPLAAARLAADTSTAMMRSNSSLFQKGLQIAGLIVPPADKVTFSPEQAEELERQLEKRLAGADKAHKWAVLRYEAQFKQLQITPKDAEFTAGLGMTFQQVCRAYGMQSPLMNDLGHATLANAREFERIEWTGALKPDAEFKAAEIREQYLPLFRGYRGAPDFCEYDFTQVSALQESASEAWAREAQMLDRGAITINQWRKGKGMPPVPWGDKPWLPVNKAPVENGQMVIPGKPDSLPDDEVNPANPAPQVSGEAALDHRAARRVLAEFAPYINGHALKGVHR